MDVGGVRCPGCFASQLRRVAPFGGCRVPSGQCVDCMCPTGGTAWAALKRGQLVCPSAPTAPCLPDPCRLLAASPSFHPPCTGTRPAPRTPSPGVPWCPPVSPGAFLPPRTPPPPEPAGLGLNTGRAVLAAGCSAPGPLRPDSLERKVPPAARRIQGASRAVGAASRPSSSAQSHPSWQKESVPVTHPAVTRSGGTCPSLIPWSLILRSLVPHSSRGHSFRGHSSQGHLSRGHSFHGHLSCGHASWGHLSRRHSFWGHLSCSRPVVTRSTVTLSVVTCSMVTRPTVIHSGVTCPVVTRPRATDPVGTCPTDTHSGGTCPALIPWSLVPWSLVPQTLVLGSLVPQSLVMWALVRWSLIPGSRPTVCCPPLPTFSP
ncbi:vegetative cell wall protein gp1-like isoform X3 [Lynx canadensis]|uniref:vegetative cell wall protein gp1-like isoform X3 n=1 Tax=Lynx canadensis TaxID=61383 RepID=UPI0011B083D2|nr:vegetative cell wall protein gp1-like isoform X3 [Lynx canadensis]